MADELDGHTGVAINGFLERKYDEHSIRDFANRLDPSWTPRPDLRADVIDDRNAELFAVAGEADVEAKVVDDDQNPRPIGPGRGNESPFRRCKRRHLGDELGETRDGQASVVLEQTTATPHELGPASPTHLARRRQQAQFARQRASVKVARGLAA